jgi:alginate O-acetyltransferase complex protein AlgI
MLFNSYQFIFQFLPVALLVTWLLARCSKAAAVVWLSASSLYFYAWWNIAHLPLLLAVMIFTYVVGLAMMKTRSRGWKAALLAAGLSGIIGVLGYFKYFNFFAGALNSTVGTTFRLDPILLPLAISFFSFQKIAFLMDVHQGKIKKSSFGDYCLFVAFFPQLIAGPIVHYREVVPQFQRQKAFYFRATDFYAGLSMFVFGLFKKVVVADSLAPIANPLFELAARGKTPTFADAWVGSLAYSLQLYFDFSGYSDMAIGLARMFGIRLPLNFNSPYKADNIIDFWRRWHITLSSFLRDYIYIPLGGSRYGKLRMFTNLFATMLIGGLWHGAGWTFLIWGFLQGLYLAVNHAWQNVASASLRLRFPVWFSWAVTFLCVVAGWVVFRAESLGDALRIMGAMISTHRIAPKLFDLSDVTLVFGLLVAALVLPNTQQIFARFRPVLGNLPFIRPSWSWRPSWGWALLTGGAFGICISCMARPSQFLYFQF